MTATGSHEGYLQDEHEPDIWPPDSAAPRWERLRAKLAQPQAVVTFVVVAVCVVFTFKELQPSQLFKNTTPAGGDMGAHVWLPACQASLLPHLRITGWTPDWYDGFPALTYYFPGPIVCHRRPVLRHPVQHRLQAGHRRSGC